MLLVLVVFIMIAYGRFNFGTCELCVRSPLRITQIFFLHGADFSLLCFYLILFVFGPKSKRMHLFIYKNDGMIFVFGFVLFPLLSLIYLFDYIMGRGHRYMSELNMHMLFHYYSFEMFISCGTKTLVLCM